MTERAATPRAVGFALLASLAVACGQPPPTPEVFPSRAYAVFSRDRLLINQLEISVAPPIALGSTASPKTISSEDPSIVSVAVDGTFRAHRVGTVRLQTPGGGKNDLVVDVRLPETLTVTPSSLVLVPGVSAPVMIEAAGSKLDWRDIEWGTTDPSLVTFDQGRVTAGPRDGTGRLVFTFGNQRTDITVTVHGASKRPIALRPPRRLALGSIQRIDVVGAPVTTVNWTTSRAEVLRDLGHGFFWARSAGTAEVCASLEANRSCAVVRVTK